MAGQELANFKKGHGWLESVITLIVVSGYMYLVVTGRAVPQNFTTVIMLIMGFLFGRNLGKVEAENKQ